MRQSSNPQKFVLEQLHDLEELWTRVRDGDGEAIHQARVTTRRIRAGLPHIRGVSTEAAEGIRRIGRKLGRVRELDVMTELLRHLQPELPEAANVIAALQQRVAQLLERRRRRLIKALDDINLGRLRRHLASAPAGLAIISSLWHDWRRDVRRELRRRAFNVHAAIERASGVYMPNRSHDVRVAIKKLRYTLELAMATGFSMNRALLSELEAAQKVLGHLHDWRVVAQEIQHLDVGAGLARGRAVLDSVVNVESSRLHRKYLRLREGVLDVCTACTRLEDNWHALERLAKVATGAVYTARVVGVPLTVWYLQNGRRNYDGRDTSVRVAAGG
jgi:CHAD domain-containing protein